MCLFEGCKKQPNFNFDGETKALFCNEHKEPLMVDIKSKRCQFIGCKKHPVFNFEGETKALFCNEHKEPLMVDIKHKRCKTHLCETQVQNPMYEGHCLRCFTYLFPDKPVLRNFKTKENTVVAHIKTIFKDFTWITDKTVEGGCSRRRPDMLLDLGHQVVIVEIDENQHIDYDCTCENKRIMEISQDIGHHPLIFIRFNPDDYINVHSKNITSCWGINSKGDCDIKKSKKTEWAERLKYLENQILYWTQNETTKTIEIIQLFYDEI